VLSCLRIIHVHYMYLVMLGYKHTPSTSYSTCTVTTYKVSKFSCIPFPPILSCLPLPLSPPYQKTHLRTNRTLSSNSPLYSPPIPLHSFMILSPSPTLSLSHTQTKCKKKECNAIACLLACLKIPFHNRVIFAHVPKHFKRVSNTNQPTNQSTKNLNLTI
jgi:hypothetical protein